MKTKRLTRLTFAAFIFIVAGEVSNAADFTWKGSGGNWSVGSNWVGDEAPSGSGHILYFSGESQTSTNNNRLVWVNGINFNAGAGEFTLDGTAFSLGGDIVNNSTSTQTISLNLTMQGHRTYYARYGDIVVEGNIAGGYNLRKEGVKTLEIKGVNSFTGVTQIMAGTLVMNASNISSNRLEFGQATGGYNIGNNAIFEVRGGNYTHAGQLGLFNNAANKVKAGDGVALTFDSYTNPGNGTVNFDISAVGSSIALVTTPLTVTGDLSRLQLATVTDGIKTGFARIDSANGNKVVRIGDEHLVDLSGNPATTIDTQARLNGNYTFTASKTVNSLTLQGASGGTVNGSGQSFQLRDILMEEGTGNYTFGNIRTASQGVAPIMLVVHQYSTSGTLTFESALMLNASAHSFVKTGPGTVIISQTSQSNYTGATRLQGGRLELDGSLSATSSMIVYDRGILSGGGRYGTSNTSTLIRTGGTLEGSGARSLDVEGQLAFEADSVYAFTLGSGADFVHVAGAVTLADTVALKLALEAESIADTPFYLLTSDTAITGKFTLNSSIMNNLDTFFLGGYEFQYFQDKQNIWVQTIPEPSAAWLAGFGLTAVFFRSCFRDKTRL